MLSVNSLSESYENDLRHYKTKSGLVCFIQHDSRIDTPQLKEKWVAKTLVPKSKSLSIKHVAIDGAKIEVPISSCGRGLRTTSNIRSINIDEILGFLLIKEFSGYKNNFLRFVLNKKSKENFSASEFEPIMNKYNSRKSFLHLNRRLFLASPGTSLVAFCSKYPFVSVDTWGFVNLNFEEAKLLSLWFNSTFGIIQLLMIGVAIEGNWMKVHKYMQNEIYVPDPERFLEEYKEEFKNLYDRVACIELPSFVNQLEEYNSTRILIDNFFIETLNLDIGEEGLKHLYIEVFNELRGLCPSNFEEK